MNQIDEIAHLIQLSVAPVFLLTGVGTLLNVLSAGIRHVFRLHVTEQVPMHGVLGAIGSQPLGFPFRAWRPKEVIFLCKATVVEQRLELFQFLRFGGRVQPVSRVPCEGDNKSKTILGSSTDASETERCPLGILLRLKQETRTTVPYRIFRERAVGIGFAPARIFRASSWKAMEEAAGEARSGRSYPERMKPALSLTICHSVSDGRLAIP
jgi:hypothetical protein